MDVSASIKYIGVNDKKIDLFESMYRVPRGVAYNSYMILDESPAVIDTVEEGFEDEWFAAIEKNGSPCYLVVQHMEPDHSSNIARFAARYPEARIVTSAKSVPMIKNFFGEDLSDRIMVVGEGDSLCLGVHTLRFVTAPMVHWPEVIVSYEEHEKVLFSADAFGKFGALDEDEPWEDEARRYYIGIVGKYGPQVQALLKKAAALDIRTVCATHGPVLRGEALARALELYGIWSSYAPETEGVLIAYSSVYGHTRTAAFELAEKLRAAGVTVEVSDLARDDVSRAVSDAFRYDRLVLATTTYNGEAFPCMKEFIGKLTERGFKSRKVGVIENGSWGPMAAKRIKAMLEASKDITWLEPTVTIMSALSDESRAQLDALAEALRS